MEAKLNALITNTESEIRKKHIKELYRILIKRKKQSQNWVQAFTFALALFNFDKTDPLSLKKAKRFSVKTNSFNELVDICQENHNIQNTFWSKLGLFDAQFRRYNKTSFGSLAVMEQLLNELISDSHLPQQKIEIHERTIRLAYKQQNLTKAHQNLLELGNFLSGTQNPHLAVRYTVLAARYFSKTQDYVKAIQVIQLALGEKAIKETSNELLVIVQNANQGVDELKEVHKTRLKKVLERLYNNQNP